MSRFQSLEEIVAVFKRRWWVALLVTLIGCAATVYLVLQQPRTWDATAVVQIEDPRVQEPVGSVAMPASDSGRQVRLIEQRLMSRDTLLEVMDRHDLFTQPAGRSVNERVFLMRQAVRIDQIVQGPAWQPGGQSPSGLRIHVSLGDPQKAADVANDLMNSVIEQSRVRAEGRAREVLEFFIAEDARVAEEIARKEDEIAAFKQANADSLPDGLEDLRAQLFNLEEAQLEFDQQILALQTNASRQREEVLQRDIARLQEQKALLVTRADQLRLQIARGPEVERMLGGLQRDLNVLQEQYAVIARRKAEAELGQALEQRQQSIRFEVLETALVPEIPSSRSRRKLAMMGGMASLFAGVALAVILEVLNPALRSPTQMERALGVAPVVSIPQIGRTSQTGRGKKTNHHKARKSILTALRKRLARLRGAMPRARAKAGPA